MKSKPIKEVYLTSLDTKITLAFKEDKLEDVTCYHPTLSVRGDDAHLTFYTDESFQCIKISKFQYKNRIFKAFVDGEEYFAVKIYTTSLYDKKGNRLNKI